MSSTQLRGGEYLFAQSNTETIFTPEDFSEEQRQIAETTEQFITNEVLPKIDEIDQQDFDLLLSLIQQAGELGLLMVDVPEEYGGLELDKATSMLVGEKIGAAGSFSTTFMAHTGIGTLPLVYYGTPEQKERYLERLTTAEWIGAYCLTEPGSGSDALGASASAILSDDGTYYTLNGTKQFITNGGFADLFTVFAKVDKQHFTGFLVERDFPGVVISAEEKKLGIKGSSTTQLILDNVKVPVENLLGEVGKGHKIAFNVLNVGRFKLGAGTTGAAKHAFAEGSRYANERKQFGRAISSFGAIQEKLADMSADIFAAESVVYRLAGLIDERIAGLDKDVDDYYDQYQMAIEEYAAECAIAKVYCSEVLAVVVDEVLQIHGGYGFVAEYPAERFYRDERIARLYEGTNEINRILIPGVVLRKGKAGVLPLEDGIQTALAALKNPVAADDGSGPFAAEKALLEQLKTLLRALIGVASQKFQDKLQQEQEVLMGLADMAIQIFAMESAVLRAEKATPAASDARKKTLAAVVKIAAFRAATKVSVAAGKVTFFAAEDAELEALLDGVDRLTRYNASKLLDAKRELAGVAIDTERYNF